MQQLSSPRRAPSRLPREPNFWRLWLCGVTIYAIRWIEQIVVAIFVYQRTESAFLVAVVSMMRSVPMALFGVAFGIMADRVDRRLCLIAVIALLAASCAVIAALAHAGRLEVWHLAVASFINGFGWTSDNPTRRIMLGDVLGTERLAAGMAIDVGANNVTRIVGPVVGGFMFAQVGIAGVFLLLLALYGVALIAVLSVRYRNAPVARGPAAGVLRQLAEGIRAVRGDATVRAVMVMTLIFNLFGWPLFSMVPVIAQDHLGLAPGEIGTLVGAEGLGSLVGAAVIGVIASQARYGLMLVAGCFAYPAMLMAFAAAPVPWLAALALLASGIGAAAFGITQITLLYAATSADIRGRVLGLLSTVIGVSPIGFVHLGLLSNALGTRQALLIVGAEGLLAVALTWRSWRGLVRPDHPGRPGAGTRNRA